MTDIDIDVTQRGRVVEGLGGIPAALVERRPHPSGVYFQDIPRDPLDGLAVWDYHQAADLGYFKIDILNTTIYDGVRDEVHLVQLLTSEPPWYALRDLTVVQRLAHLHGHFAVVQAIQPTCIEDLAVCLAVIRPGKRYLLSKSRVEIDREIWTPLDNDAYHYKRAHALAYAASIVVQLNLLHERHHFPPPADCAD